VHVRRLVILGFALMALGFAHGAVQWLAADAATTVYTVSGLSFQPKALRFYWVGIGSATDAATETVHQRRGMGFATGTASRRSVGTQDQDATGNATCTSGFREDAVAFTVTSTPAFDGLLDLNSITADGFTLIVDDAAPADITVFWEAWGGTDITVAVDLSIAEPAATGNVDYTVTGFEATDSDDQVVMFAGVQSTAAAGTAQRNDSGFMVGFASGGAAGENVVATGNVDDGFGTADADRYGLDSECLAMITVAGGNPSARAQLTQFNTNGFRLNWIARATTNRRYIALAIKGGSWRVGSYTLNDGTVGNTVTVSGLPFAPVGISLLGIGLSESTPGTSSGGDMILLGTGSSTTSRRSQSCFSEDGPTTMEVNLAVEYDQVLNAAGATGSVFLAHDIDAMLSDGFRIIVDVASASTRWYGYHAFGDAPIAFDPAFMAAMSRPWRDIVHQPHQVVASGMTPSELINP